jgi:hypothetical protein
MLDVIISIIDLLGAQLFKDLLPFSRFFFPGMEWALSVAKSNTTVMGWYGVILFMGIP